MGALAVISLSLAFARDMILNRSPSTFYPPRLLLKRLTNCHDPRLRFKTSLPDLAYIPHRYHHQHHHRYQSAVLLLL